MASKGGPISLVAFDEEESLATSIRNATIEPAEFFINLTACRSFIEQQAKQNKVTILITTSIDHNVLKNFESLVNVEAILILSSVEIDIDSLPCKVIGIYHDKETLLRAMFDTIEAVEKRVQFNSLLYHRRTDGNDNLNFYFYYLWKNYFKDDKSSKTSLVECSLRLYQTNSQIKTFIRQFDASYRPNQALTWLNKQHNPFPYHLLLSDALRNHDKELLLLGRFFLSDLSKKMKPVPAGSNYKEVYISVQLPTQLVEQLAQKTKTDILAFQCFLPAIQSRSNALSETNRPCRNPNMLNVFIKIDLTHGLCIDLGETVLIDMATPFSISCVTRTTVANNANAQQTLTIIKLIALSKYDRDRLYEQFIQRQLQSGKTIEDLLRAIFSDISDDEALADQQMARGEWSQAAATLAGIFNPSVRVLNKRGNLLRERLHNYSESLQCHQQALIMANDQQHAETLIYIGLVHKSLKEHAEAFDVYTKALEWFEKQDVPDFAMIARCLIGLGNAQWARRQFTEALGNIEQALHIREHEIEPRDELEIAACLGNMSNIYYGQGDLPHALEYAIRVVDLLNGCEQTDPRLAAAYNNIGAIYQSSGDFAKAREYFERALNSVPYENHPHRQSTLANLARLETMEQSQEQIRLS